MLTLIKGTYVSGDELNRAAARKLGFETVYQHPNEVGILGGDEVLVIDYDLVLFDDKATAEQVALAAARSGVPVGIHTRRLDDPRVAGMATEPLLVVAKTFQGAVAKARKLAAARMTADVL